MSTSNRLSGVSLVTLLNIKKLLDLIMKEVEDSKITSVSVNSGICARLSRVDLHVGDPIAVVAIEGMIRDWPEYSGNEVYPVSAPWYYEMWSDKHVRAEMAYYNLPRWSGVYGKKRYRLMNWMIGMVKAELVKREAVC